MHTLVENSTQTFLVVDNLLNVIKSNIYIYIYIYI